VGGSIEEACLNALFLERALKVQLTASLLGKVVPISEKIVLNMFTMFNQNPKRSEEIWDYLVRKLKREGLAFDQS
jgi:ribulose-5-phosphate 4-epimerase/fuculose-1-phosphate aldolase